jgi:hypothetical protein
MAARNEDTPSIQEIAELTARLRQLSAAGSDADPAERAAFLTDKDALIARIEAANHRAATADEARTDTAAGTDEPQNDERSAINDDGGEWSR